MNLGILALLTRAAPPAAVDAKPEAAAEMPAGLEKAGANFERMLSRVPAEKEQTTLPALAKASVRLVPATDVDQAAIATDMALANNLDVELPEASEFSEVYLDESTELALAALQQVQAQPAVPVNDEKEETAPLLSPEETLQADVLAEEITAQPVAQQPAEEETADDDVLVLKPEDAVEWSEDKADDATVLVALATVAQAMPVEQEADVTAVEAVAITDEAAGAPVVAPELMPQADVDAPDGVALPHVPTQAHMKQMPKGVDRALEMLSDAKNPNPADVIQRVQLAMELKQQDAALQAVAPDAADAPMAAQQAAIDWSDILHDAEAPELDDDELEAVVARLLHARSEAKAVPPALNVSPQSFTSSSHAAVPYLAAQPESLALADGFAAPASDGDGVDVVSAPSTPAAPMATDATHRPATVGQLSKVEHFAGLLHQTTPSEQVQVSIKRALNQGLDRVTINMQPEELGRVEVRMDVGADGRSLLVFNVENRDTMDMLQRDVRQLERLLQDSGINAQAGDMQFNLQQRQAQGDGNDSGERKAYANAPVEATAEADAYIDATTGHYTVTVKNGLDIRV